MVFQSSTDAAVVKAAIALLREGKATHQEVATLAGTSRQLVRHWCKRAKVNAPQARTRYLARLWQRVKDKA